MVIPGKFPPLVDLTDFLAVFSSPKMRLKMNLVVDEDGTERAFLLRVVRLQLWHGLVVATLY